tara:strand:+ start:1034 stop:1294 length:261 start_codon:yes stop_codon:yes gene_type:complete
MLFHLNDVFFMRDLLQRPRSLAQALKSAVEQDVNESLNQGVPVYYRCQEAGVMIKHLPNGERFIVKMDDCYREMVVEELPPKDRMS